MFSGWALTPHRQLWLRITVDMDYLCQRVPSTKFCDLEGVKVYAASSSQAFSRTVLAMTESQFHSRTGQFNVCWRSSLYKHDCMIPWFMKELASVVSVQLSSLNTIINRSLKLLISNLDQTADMQLCGHSQTVFRIIQSFRLQKTLKLIECINQALPSPPLNLVPKHHTS